MKIQKFDFYWSVVTVLIAVFIAAAIGAMTSCNTEEKIEPKPHVIFPMDNRDMLDNITTRGIIQTHQDAPLDWAYTPLPAIVDTTPVDTVVIDTLPIDTPCVPQLYLTPLFVTGFMEIDETVTTDIEVWVYPHHATATEGEQIPFILDSLLNEYDPSLTYRVYQSDADWRRMAFIAKGTLDKEHFHGEVFIRFNGHNSGWGFGVTPQAFLFAGSLTYEEYSQAIQEYPSVNYFNFRNTEWDSIQYVKAALEINDCKIGRYWADFRFNPIQIPDSIIVMYQNSGWTYVLH